MRQLRDYFRLSRARTGNAMLDKLNSSPRHDSKGRILRLLALLQEVDRGEKLLWEDLSTRMGQTKSTMATHEFQELWASPSQRKYYLALNRVNRLLRRYQSFPVMQEAFFDVDEYTGLRFSWSIDRSGMWQTWENEAAAFILNVIERKQFHRLRRCRSCSKWFYGQTDHQVHCNDNCRKQFASRDPRFKERRRLYMAKRRREDKSRDLIEKQHIKPKRRR
jgi:hypothetical protein